MKSDGYKKTLRAALANCEVVQMGVDYLTVTTEDEGAKRSFGYIYAKGAAQAERLGDRRKKQGFQGFLGEGCGPWFLGRREGLWLLRIKSHLAHDAFHDVSWGAVNCSRVDVQVSIRLPGYNPDVAAAIGAIRAANAEERNIKLSPIQDLHGGYGRGDTLYIGSRESPRFGRCYDKEKQSNEEAWERVWRFEVEYKKICAPIVAGWLREQPDLRLAAAQATIGQFAEWGIELPLGIPGQLIAGSIGRRDYDSERSMRWLREQVAPTIERLLATIDRESIEEALGLIKPIEDTMPTVTQEWPAETGQEAPQPARNGGSALRDGKWW